MTTNQQPPESSIFLANSPDDRLISPSMLADELDIKKGTLAVWRTTKRYQLPYFKVGRLVKYRVGDVRAFLRNNGTFG